MEINPAIATLRLGVARKRGAEPRVRGLRWRTAAVGCMAGRVPGRGRPTDSSVAGGQTGNTAPTRAKFAGRFGRTDNDGVSCWPCSGPSGETAVSSQNGGESLGLKIGSDNGDYRTPIRAKVVR